VGSGYTIKLGSSLDRAALLKFMRLTYGELFPTAPLGHLATTVDRYFSAATPLWWLDDGSDTVGCLWVGTAIDQVLGDAHPYVFLLYVKPAHRRQGLARALMAQLEIWARARGDRQIGLQVFASNPAAIDLYQSLGYEIQAITMRKPLT
jgi:ribosomal protein S18 acetylase RimI-like enzyme